MLLFMRRRVAGSRIKSPRIEDRGPWDRKIEESKIVGRDSSIPPPNIEDPGEPHAVVLERAVLEPFDAHPDHMIIRRLDTE